MMMFKASLVTFDFPYGKEEPTLFEANRQSRGPLLSMAPELDYSQKYVVSCAGLVVR